MYNVQVMFMNIKDTSISLVLIINLIELNDHTSLLDIPQLSY